MPEYIFKCPICKKQYKLTPKNPQTLSQKIFTCPNCRYSAPFPTLIKGLITPQPQNQQATSNGKSVSPNAHSLTKVAQNRGVSIKAYLTVVGYNSKFILNQGLYVLGRKSSDSRATLQIAPDISMSRQHARLAILSVGGRIIAQILGLKADNPVIVNGKMCPTGQPCTLKSGDVLQLGMTRIVFTI